MTDGSLPDRLAQLRSRWAADPASRVFLQLAEEYRHQGRLQEALGILDEGLREHPGYLSALVAKGRCLLELGQPEAAREVLERVVRQDATQMVANKLLVRAHLDTGQAALARERLDLYSLLHDGDPEVEELRARIQRLGGAPGDGAAPPPPTAPMADPASFANPASTLPEDGDVFQLGAPAAAPHPEVQDVFDLGTPAPQPVPVPESAPTPAPSAAAAAAPLPADDDEPEPVADGEPFAGLVSRAVRRRHFAALVAEGIFAFELPAALAPPAHDTAPETVAADLAPPPAPEAAAEPAPEPAPPAAPAWAGAEAATATLGDLYLRQGHASEAERIFGEVLRREPDNAAAHEGLAAVRSRREPAAPAIQPAAVPLERKAKRIQMLNSYLDRIRRGSGRHVS